MERYICSICSYIYNPETGIPEQGIEPGTSFDKLPEEWVCPPCFAPKDLFAKEI